MVVWRCVVVVVVAGGRDGRATCQRAPSRACPAHPSSPAPLRAILITAYLELSRSSERIVICNSISLYPMTRQCGTETRRKERLDNTNIKEQHIKQHVVENSTEKKPQKNSRSQSPSFLYLIKQRKGRGEKRHTKKEQNGRKECTQKNQENQEKIKESFL
jgi:hypothetical protein